MGRLNWIMVPVDFSHDTQQALGKADMDAARLGYGLLLVHVKANEPRRTQMTIESETVRRWGRFIRRTPASRVAYVTCVGDPIEKIVEAVETYRPRAVYMGRGGTAERPGLVATAIRWRFSDIVRWFAVTDGELAHAA